jgi:hypothetical protein
MTVPRCQVGAGVLDGLLFAVGGYNDMTDIGWVRTVEKYDEASNSWSFVASFPQERQYPAVAVH